MVEELAIDFGDGGELVDDFEVFDEFEEVVDGEAGVEVLGGEGCSGGEGQAAEFVPLAQTGVLAQDKVGDLLAYHEPETSLLHILLALLQYERNIQTL